MKRIAWCAMALAAGLASPAAAQSLAASVTSADGAMEVVFPSRANVCGDGRDFIRTLRSRGSDEIYSSGAIYSSRSSWSNRPCARGPERVLATVIGGEVTRLSTFVGPLPASQAGVRRIDATAADAAAWLSDLASRARGRVAGQAMRALMFADAPEPWPLLLRLARTSERPRDVRQAALTWLSFGVTDHLGLADVDDHATDDDEMRTQAVFVLTQRKGAETVTELIDLSRHAKYASARKAAIFWLGQSGDPRAVDVFAELLGVR